MIQLDDASGTVLLSTPRTAYALRLDVAAGTVRQVHWGAAVSLAEASALPVPAWDGDSLAGRWDAAEELPVEGGLRYGVPAVEVRYADGTSACEPRLTGHEIHPGEEASELVLHFADAGRPLAWALHYRVRRDSDVLERWTVYRNTAPAGGDRVLLVRHGSAHWTLPVRPGYRLGAVGGNWSQEFLLERVELPRGETTLTSRRGHTGHQSNPWVQVDDGTATEDGGEVWSVALAASGSWRITVQRTPEGRCGVVCGAGHEGSELELAPGGELVTPIGCGLYSARGFGGSSRAWHAYVRGHVLPAGGELRPVLYNSWEATAFEVTEENQVALAERAARLGVELFVVDDGWFGNRDDDRAGLGDWEPHRRRFPRGLRPLADRVHALGMAFGLWVEPEMVNPDSALYRAHPDWVLHLPDRAASEQRHQLVLDFSRAEVADWAFGWLDRTVRAYAVDFLKWDFNRSFSEAGSAGAGRDRRRVFTAHAEGFHRVLDRLRAAHPALRIESCSSGGGRVDLGVLARTDQVWPSDNTDAVDRLAIQHGFSQLYPAAVAGSWVTDSPNPLTGRAVPLRFRFHTAMAGVLGLGGDLARWSAAELQEAAALVAAYKRVRPLVQHGAQYRLGEPMGTGTSAVWYAAPDGGGGVLFQWRVGTRPRAVPPTLRLPGLDPAASYAVHDDSAPGDRVVTGRSLAAVGLPGDLPGGPFASRMVHLVRG
ncbi:alpha-galactosidase [Streptomyces longwoodensis]|uniref:alpha-galactosidase n=1 Tax=Streptomyces longwoodensis TaxID=68231 RepID=UPI0033C91052